MGRGIRRIDSASIEEETAILGFGSKRKKAAAMGVEGARPYIGMVQGLYGVPGGFWRDPYILGFLITTITLFCKLATKNKISGGDLGFAIFETLTVLSNMNGEAIGYIGTELAEAKDPDYLRASEDAMAIFLYTFRMHNNEANDPLVIEATDILDAGGLGVLGENRREQIAGFMMQQSYMKQVRERFFT